jgi:hypothetical protein
VTHHAGITSSEKKGECAVREEGRERGRERERQREHSYDFYYSILRVVLFYY